MFKFDVKKDNKGGITVVDVSNAFDSFPTKIFSFSLSIQGSSIPKGFVENLDILQYLYFNRVDNELYRITPETLGLSSNSSIPDDIYYLTFRVNNTEEYKLDFIVLDEVSDKIKKLVNSIDVDINIEDNSIFTKNLPLDAETSRIYYVMAIYFKLLTLLHDDKNHPECNDLLDKLQRILSIVI